MDIIYIYIIYIYIYAYRYLYNVYIAFSRYDPSPNIYEQLKITLKIRHPLKASVY